MIRKSLFVLLPAILLAGCFNKMPERLNPLDPQYSKNGIITGTIKDKAGNPYSAFYVETFENQDTLYTHFETVNSSGKYIFIKSEGKYNLWATVNMPTNQYFCAYARNLEVKPGETTKQDIMVKQLFISPKTNESVSTTPVFSWETYPGAVTYQLIVYKSTNWEYRSGWNSFLITGTSCSLASLDSGFTYHAVVYVYSTSDPYDPPSYELAYSRINIKVP
jgi:hypothetical protein